MARRKHKVQPVTITYADGSSETVPAREITDRKWTYARYRRGAQWKTLRRAVLKRDGYRCAHCKGRHDSPLEVHHKTYVRIGRERLDDLVTLCQRCHATEHQWIQRQKRALTHHSGSAPRVL